MSASDHTDISKQKDQAALGKTQLERKFSSELLLQQAIAGLLTRMPDVSEVQILQGTQELGKDLVFYTRGGFGERLLCACVVKNTKISGDVARSGGARTVLLQAEQAFDSPYTDSFGRDVQVERVYIVTPFDLSPATMMSIKGRLRERAGQVVFLGGSYLFDLFEKYWPDYFADEATAIEQHMKETKDMISGASPLEELASQYNLGAIRTYDKKVYVAQALYRDLNSYTLGNIVRESLPTERQIDWQMTSKEVHAIEDKVSFLKRFVTAVHEWKFCGERDRDDIFNHSDRFLTALNGILEEITKEQRRLTKKGKKIGQNPDNEEIKIDYVSPGRDELGKLVIIQNRILVRIEKELSNLRVNVSAGDFVGVAALSEPSYLRSSIIDEFARSEPEGVFQSQDGIRVDFPKEILTKWDGHLMIVGSPGYGKTSFCRWHALHDAESFSAGKSNIIPVYVPLSRFSTRPVTSFEDSFLRSLGKSALLGGMTHAASARVRIYLDGLDEIASPERRLEIVELAKKGAVTNGKYQIILTSRDYVYGRWLDWLPRVALGGLEKSDINELIDKWFGKDSESNRRFRKELSYIPMLDHLMRTPLLATLVIMVFRQTGKLPESKTRLYEIFTNLLSGGWDLAKGVLRQSKFGERVKLMVLSNLAGYLLEQRRSVFYGKDIREASRAVFAGRIRDEWELLLQEVIIDGLVSKSGDVMQFSHLSFQEFLAAKDFMGRPKPTKINHALESYLHGDGWWKEVIKFYIGLSSNPAEIKKWLGDRLRQFYLQSVIEPSVLQVHELLSAISEAFPGSTHSVKEAERLVKASRV